MVVLVDSHTSRSAPPIDICTVCCMLYSLLTDPLDGMFQIIRVTSLCADNKVKEDAVFSQGRLLLCVETFRDACSQTLFTAIHLDEEDELREEFLNEDICVTRLHTDYYYYSKDGN